MARKPRCDSIAYQVEAMQRVKETIEPPIYLNTQERAVFDDIVSEFPHDTWERHRIRIAAQLSKVMVLAELTLIELMLEGPTIWDERRLTQVVNPKHTAFCQLNGVILATSRTLGITGKDKIGKRGDLLEQISAEQEAKQLISKAPSLLAM